MPRARPLTGGKLRTAPGTSGRREKRQKGNKRKTGRRKKEKVAETYRSVGSAGEKWGWKSSKENIQRASVDGDGGERLGEARDAMPRARDSTRARRSPSKNAENERQLNNRRGTYNVCLASRRRAFKRVRRDGDKVDEGAYFVKLQFSPYERDDNVG